MQQAVLEAVDPAMELGRFLILPGALNDGGFRKMEYLFLHVEFG
jgi:hypothetical protein